MFIISNLKSVNEVVLSIDLDRTQCETIKSLQAKLYDSYHLAFANCGDQKNKSIPEAPVCLELGIELGFRSKDDAEEGYVVKNISEYKLEEGRVFVKVDPKYYRPTEVDLLIGDPKKAMNQLRWKPKYDLAALVKEMVASDVSLFKKQLYIK